MHDRPESSQDVRRVVLPSGKTIEVVYYEESSPRKPTTPPRAAEASDRIDLHVCTSCHSDLVYPEDWEEVGTTHWQVTLRCPNCEWTGCDVFDQTVVERFDAELDRATETLVGDLRRLMAANMEGEIERFASALEANAVLPEDFGRPAPQA